MTIVTLPKCSRRFSPLRVSSQLRCSTRRPCWTSLAEFQPEIILIDIGLPVVDGYELALRVRAKEKFQHVRLIAITGYGQESDRQRALAAGFSDHLVKPVDMKYLERLLREDKRES